MIATAVLLGAVTRWHVRFLSTVEAQQIIAEHPDALFLVARYKDGSSDLSITLRGSKGRPDFKAPGYPTTLSLLSQEGIAFRTYIQGPDFGFAEPTPRRLLGWIIVLVTGAILLLGWAWRSRAASLTSAQNT